MSVTVIRHVPFEHLGAIADVLEKRAIPYEYEDLYASQSFDTGRNKMSALIIMGGPQSANDPFPYIAAEIERIQRAIAAGIPVLGICLGAQLIAKALGERVYRNPVKEIGWYDVRWSEQAAVDPLFTGFAGSDTVFHWHGETFDLPPGAIHLASSEACRNQAFRYRGHVYGIQFHLEVTPPMIENWLAEDANCGDVRELDAPVNAAHNAERLAEMAETVFGRWAALVEQR